MRLNLNEVISVTGLNMGNLLEVLGIETNDSLYHWLRHKHILDTKIDQLPPAVGKNIGRMFNIIMWALAQHDGRKKSAQKWFKRRHRELKMKPLDLLRSAGGLKKIENFLRPLGEFGE